MESDIFKRYRDILQKYVDESRFRHIPADRTSPGRIDLSSNDYLGLASCGSVIFRDLISDESVCFSSSASRLLASRQNAYNKLECKLETLYGRPALLFNSGYHANTGCISALSIPGTVFLTDKLIHASAIDGIRLAKAEFARWNHNDTNHLRCLLEKYDNTCERMIVVAESIYSMDGDLAPLESLVALKHEYPKMMLYLDEAHAFGVRGKRGLGLAEETGLLDEVDILVGTFGKACASQGAFAVGSRLIIDFLINNARSFIFSTALPPVNAMWTCKMIDKIVGMEPERKKLLEMSEKFRNFIDRISNCANPSASQIIPLMTGDAAKALDIARRLGEAGIDALAIRRPTVPPGGERIRFSLNASITDGQLDKTMRLLETILRSYEN